MIKFEPVSRFKDANLPIPTRATENAAGYDFVVAENVINIPSSERLFTLMCRYVRLDRSYTLEEISKITKDFKVRPTLVSTGMKCYLEPDTYLELSVRSSTPLKHWLILANGVGKQIFYKF